MTKFFYTGILACSLLGLGSCSNADYTAEDSTLNSEHIKMKEMRAKAEEHRGTVSKEKVQELNLEQYEPITSYTEVVKGKLNTFVEVKEAAEVRLSIIDAKGMLINSFSKASPAGLNRYELDFSDLEVGQYYVTLVANDVYRRFCVAKTQ